MHLNAMISLIEAIFQWDNIIIWFICIDNYSNHSIPWKMVGSKIESNYDLDLGGYMKEKSILKAVELSRIIRE